jgi:alkylhydroperoxidase family enzyme
MVETATRQSSNGTAGSQQAGAADGAAMGPYLPPIERPKNPLLKLAYYFTKRRFGRVMGPLTVFSARMPFGFTSFSMKVATLDKKLKLPRDTAVLIRERVASINGCLFCQDASRWYLLRQSMSHKAKLDALPDYGSSPLFTEAERAALDYATELTRNKHVQPETFARLRRFYSEREVCDIVWLVASEHLWNMANIGLNIGSDGLCELDPKLRTDAVSSSTAA